MKDKLKALLAFVEREYAKADKELSESIENDAISALQFTTDVLEDIANTLRELIAEVETSG